MTECNDFSTDGRFSSGYGMSDRAHVIRLFTRSRSNGKECMAPMEYETPNKAPPTTSSSHHGLRLLGQTRRSADNIRYEEDICTTALIHDESDSSRECLYTPAEVASTPNLPLTSPQLKLQEFEQELAKIKAKRMRQRSALREQVLRGADIYASCDSQSPSSRAVVLKNPGTGNERDDPVSVSSRSSEENLTFVDATDELNDEEESAQEETKTSNTESVDFSFLHSVYRGKGQHEEAILLRMKYAGGKGLRKATLSERESSNSINGKSPPPEADAEVVKEFIRGTLLNWDGRASIMEKSSTAETTSVSASGSTTPRHRCRDFSRSSSIPTSNRTSKTSFEGDSASPAHLYVTPDPPTQRRPHLTPEDAPAPVRRPLSPSPKPSVLLSQSPPSSPRPPSKSEPSLFSNQSAFQKDPVLFSPQCSICDEHSQSELSGDIQFQEYPSDSPQLSCCKGNPSSESKRHSSYYEYSTSKSLLRGAHYEHVTSKSSLISPHHSSLEDCGSESLPDYDQNYQISECSTENDRPFKSDRSDRGSTKALEIPITIDGRVVYPDIVFAEDVRTPRTLGPLGLLDKVKSFAQTCGLGTEAQKQASTDGYPEGGKNCTEFNAALLSRLTCVRCGLLCTPPVATCVWGHIVCEECCPVSLWENHGRSWYQKKCPHCSRNMMSKPCELWSNIARSLLYPCRYTAYGCRETQGLTPADKLLHEEACLWRQLRCWCPGCSWQGSWHKLRTHVDQVHLPSAIHANWYRFVPVLGATRTGRSCEVIALPVNELVLLHSLTVIGENRYLLQYLKDDRGGGAVVVVPRFKLRVTSRDAKFEIEVRGEAVPGQHDVERALRSGKCFRLSATPFGRTPIEELPQTEVPTVQLCLEKGRLSVS